MHKILGEPQILALGYWKVIYVKKYKVNFADWPYEKLDVDDFVYLSVNCL